MRPILCVEKATLNFVCGESNLKMFEELASGSFSFLKKEMPHIGEPIKNSAWKKNILPLNV